MMALSVRQPWAWFLAYGFKNVENRNWKTKFRGQFLIHAAKGMTYEEWLSAIKFAREVCGITRDQLAAGGDFSQLQRGGVIGVAEIHDCVTSSHSPWFMGTHGFMVRNAKPLPFTPWRGQLNFFHIPTTDSYRCDACRSVGALHCSDPINCGGMVVTPRPVALATAPNLETSP